MNRKKSLIICGMAVMLLSGCTKSNIVTGGPAEPVFETQEGIVLDWTQIGDGLDGLFLDNDEYPMAVSINFNATEIEQNKLDLTLMVKEGTTPEEAVKFADAAVRALNDEVSIQDFSSEASSDSTYGGFSKKTDINLIVMPNGMMSDEAYWLVNMTIPAGSEEKIAAAEGAKLTQPTSGDEGEDSGMMELEVQSEEAE